MSVSSSASYTLPQLMYDYTRAGSKQKQECPLCNFCSARGRTAGQIGLVSTSRSAAVRRGPHDAAGVAASLRRGRVRTDAPQTVPIRPESLNCQAAIRQPSELRRGPAQVRFTLEKDLAPLGGCLPGLRIDTDRGQAGPTGQHHCRIGRAAGPSYISGGIKRL